MKIVLGLDLGTNSIGWALIKQNFENKEGEILGLGSRIIPMSQDIMGKFDAGQSISQTAERTGYRGARRLRERFLLRRERLHRVLNILSFLPEHYSLNIDFTKKTGQFISETEPKLVYNGSNQFIFKTSFEEMLGDFRKEQPKLVNNDKKVPADWTIYYLRKKALTQKIDKEELAWLLLHFNQKRGYYQLRGEEEEENPNKLIEFHSLKVVEVIADEQEKGKPDLWYNIILENGWIYRRASKTPLFDWKDKTRDFIVTTDLNDDGSVKTDKEGNEKRSFRAPAETDWTLVKKKTESEIDNTNKTVGEYIYDTLLQSPNQKIKGKLIRTIERKYYKQELKRILEKQSEFHPILQDEKIYLSCIEELYPHNESHRSNISKKNFVHLFLEDILFYQRPLKSQKNLINGCPFESTRYIEDGIQKTKALKCIPKSHPLFQEFRLWQWLQNLKIYNRDTDQNLTSDFLSAEENYIALFDFLNKRKEIDQKALLKHLKLSEKTHRWNFVEDKKYPCNETYSMIQSRLEKVKSVPNDFLTSETEFQLWHIIYSVNDKIEYDKAIRSFAVKHSLDIETFVENFRKTPPLKNEYGSYSAKAVKKLLPLMRMGKCWSWNNINEQTKIRIERLQTGEFDENIKNRVREKAIHLKENNDFKGLPIWLVSNIVYDRHSESSDNKKWKSVSDLEAYIKSFKQHSLRNPIVEQVVTETLRVVNDIWKHYGKGEENFFNEIHIELGREMKNPADKRKKMTSQISENENTNLRIKALLAEMLYDTSVENVRPYSPMQQEALKIYEDGVLNSNIEIPEDIVKISKSPQPSKTELLRYKLWLEQKYRSPYTGNIIPLSSLFTLEYEIEHIIPQSRYFDNSFSNKVICESAVNKLKDNKTGKEFIKDHHGQIVEISFGKTVKIFEEEVYEEFVKDHYSKNRTKRNKLLMEEIPEKMIERQLNDTRFISKFVMSTLSNIVREENSNDDGVNSKNILASNGQITSTLKQDWGLNDVWNDLILPRFERLNELTNSKNFTSYNKRYQKNLPSIPLELSKGFQKKRIDHRHHSVDALIIACATRSHINFLNNQNALEKNKSKEEKQRSRNDLRTALCKKEYNEGSEKNYRWIFKQPWNNFIIDSKNKLETTIISFKQNIRVINKTTNLYESYKDENGNLRLDKNGKPKKEKIKQIKGESWAIRKSMHTPMPYGKKEYYFDVLKIADNVGKLDLIIDETIKLKVQSRLRQLNNKITETQKYLKNNPLKDQNDKPVLTSAFNIKTEKFRRKQPISKLSNRGQGGVKTIEDAMKFIEKIADLKLQQDLIMHLNFNEHDLEKAFSSEGLERFNQNRKVPVFNVPIAENGSSRFLVGNRIGTKHKWVEAAEGTNLFFAIYVDENNKRSYTSIPFNIVIERQKQGLVSAPEIDSKGNKLLFYISPNDLVYVPNLEEIENPNLVDFKYLSKEQVQRIYKFVSCTGGEGHFVSHNYSKEIVSNENGSNNKNERMLEYVKLNTIYDDKLKPMMIKSICWKLSVNRLGQITKIIR